MVFSKTQRNIVTRDKPNRLWYLLPIFLGWVGGIIGYFVFRKSNKKFGERLLVVGLIMIIVWYGISVVFSILNIDDDVYRILASTPLQKSIVVSEVCDDGFYPSITVNKDGSKNIECIPKDSSDIPIELN